MKKIKHLPRALRLRKLWIEMDAQLHKDWAKSLIKTRD